MSDLFDAVVTERVCYMIFATILVLSNSSAMNSALSAHISESGFRKAS